MSEIIGIVPGAGRPSRIGSFFKELAPINVDPGNPSKIIVVSERIIEMLGSAGATPIYFVVNSDKGVIFDHFLKSHLLWTGNLYFTFQNNMDKYYGMPFAIDKIYSEARGKTVLMGMPDTLIEPDDAFSIVLNRFRERHTDLELGLFETRPGNYGGYIQFDPNTAKVTHHIDKTARGFRRATADNAWAIACWGNRFTEFIHRFITDKRDEYEYAGFGQFAELLFGDLIDAALLSPDLVVTAGFVSRDRGYYLDVTEPSKLLQALDRFHPRRGSPICPSGTITKMPAQVFISHSSAQKDQADNLYQMLNQAGYHATLDSYDVRAGQEIPKRIQSLINECDFFVLLLSEESARSMWVQTEITLAYSRGLVEEGRLLPVQLGPISNDCANSLPLIPRSSYNWLDGGSGLEGVIDWLAAHSSAEGAR